MWQTLNRFNPYRLTQNLTLTLLCIRRSPHSAFRRPALRADARGRVRGWANFFVYPFADVAELRSENTSDKKLIVHTLSLKEGFFVGYI